MPIGYKWLMIAAMTIGRVEILSVLMALVPVRLKE
jgi:Trk-type K+ transport system membrane component